MASGSDRKASSSLARLTSAAPAALLADLRIALSGGLNPAVAAALIRPIENALATPGSVGPAALVLAFEQLEDALEVVLFPPDSTPPA